MRYLLGGLTCLTMLFTISCAHKAKDSSTVTAQKEAEQQKADKSKEAKADKQGPTYTCIVNKDTRIVELDKTPKRCEVHYTKFGDKAQVAWAEATPTICSDVFDRIRENIESKGFKCQLGTAKHEHSEEHKEKEAKKEDKKTASRDKASVTN